MIKSIELKNGGDDVKRYQILEITFDDGSYEVLVSGTNNHIFKRAYGSVSASDSLNIKRRETEDGNKT